MQYTTGEDLLGFLHYVKFCLKHVALCEPKWFGLKLGCSMVDVDYLWDHTICQCWRCSLQMWFLLKHWIGREHCECALSPPCASWTANRVCTITLMLWWHLHDRHALQSLLSTMQTCMFRAAGNSCVASASTGYILCMHIVAWAIILCVIDSWLSKTYIWLSLHMIQIYT